MKDTEEILQKLEAIIPELKHTLRYEKGNFKAGSCVIKGSKLVIVNKHFTEEGKIRSLVDIIRILRQGDQGEQNELLSEESQVFLADFDED